MSFKQKKFLLFFLFIFIFFLFPLNSHALECKPGFTYNNQEELAQIKNLCEQKLSSLSNQRNSLVSEIQYMDTQVYLTTLKISETEKKIEKTTEEIDSLSSKIEGLDDSLNHLLKALLKRVVYNYKQHSVSPFSILLDSQGANDFLARYKYLKTAEENNQKLLIQVQSAKSNYEEQKKMREEKKIELASLSALLSGQKIDLINQQEAKRRLLEVTRNDEITYQNLFDQARRQLSSFQAFVQSAGGGVVGADGLGKGNLGWYFTQRDERWAARLIGYSDMNIMQVGCLLTDVAMLYNKYGESVTPADIASQADRFFSNTALMLVPWRGPGGRSYNAISTGQIDGELSQGNPVVVGVYAGSYGSHYVILVSKDGDDYIMYDPYYGPDLKFSSYYGFGSIFSAAVFK